MGFGRWATQGTPSKPAPPHLRPRPLMISTKFIPVPESLKSASQQTGQHTDTMTVNTPVKDGDV